MSKAIFLILSSLLAIQVVKCAYNGIPPEANYNFKQLASSQNYPVEEYQVTTSDGYILTFFRIQARGTQIRNSLPPLILNHGLLDSSDSFIFNDEPQCPGFLLANAGFDVWFVNNRGNKYSIGHVNPTAYNSSDANSIFWDFSWQEMSERDLPATFEFVAQHTGQKVSYVGHSEGSTIMFAALARRDPIIVNNLNKFIALAPAVFLEHSTSILAKIGGWIDAGSLLAELDHLLDRKKFGWMSDSMRTLWENICLYALPICVARVRLLSDANTTVDNVKRFKITTGHYPAGSSVQNILYWSQMYNKPTFNMFDHGAYRNLEIYGTPHPPVYDLSQITEAVYMFVGEYDELATPEDTATLRAQLTGSSHVEYRTYPLGHGSFLWALDVATYVNDVINILRS